MDVRRYPASRRHPQFGAKALVRALSAHGIAYEHEPALGGHREPWPDSTNLFWRIAAFRGYADYMQTAPFTGALARLVARAASAPTAILCAEKAPSDCHRQLIADVLVARGHAVTHLVEAETATVHRLNAGAVVDEDGNVTYPAATQVRRSGLRSLLEP